jgi:hypothetical protein
MTKVFLATAIRQTGSFPVTSDVHVAVSSNGYAWDYKGLLVNVPTADFNYRTNIVRAWGRIYFCPVVITGFSGGGASIKSIFYSEDNGDTWNTLDLSSALGSRIIRRMVFSEKLNEIVLITSGTTVNPSGTVETLDISHTFTTLSGSISNTILPTLVGVSVLPAFWSPRLGSFYYTIGTPTRLDRFEVNLTDFTITTNKVLEDDGVTLKNFNKAVTLDAQTTLVSLDFDTKITHFSEDGDLWGFESIGGFYYVVRRSNNTIVQYFKTLTEAESAVLSLDTSNPLDAPHTIQGEFIGGAEVMTGVPTEVTTVTSLRTRLGSKEGVLLLNRQNPTVGEGGATYTNGWRMTTTDFTNWNFSELTENTEFKDVYSGSYGSDLKSNDQNAWVISGRTSAYNDVLGYGVWILGKTDGSYIVVKSDDPFAKDAEVLT